MKYIKRIYPFIIIFASIIIVLISIFYSGTETPSYDKKIFDYSSGWSFTPDDGVAMEGTIPTTFDSSVSQVTFSKTLPGFIKDGSNIIFYTSHETVKAYIDDKMIYSFGISSDSGSKTPGNAWNFISISAPYAGKAIKIVITNCYKGSERLALPVFMYGTQGAGIWYVLSKNLFSFFISMLLLVIGLSVIIIYTVLHRKVHICENVLWLGIFSVMLSLWSAAETHLVALFIGHNLLENQLSFIALKLLLIPSLIFISTTLNTKDNLFNFILCCASAVDTIVSCILQITGLLDFKLTITCTHILFLIYIVYVIYITVKTLHQNKHSYSNKNTKQQLTIIHSICLLIVSIAMSADIFNNYFSNKSDAATFTRLGLLIYIMVLGNAVLADSVNMIKQGEEAELIKKQAVTDSLTKLKNRVGFEVRLNELAGSDYSEYGIAMFDLNNLKLFNDKHGHSMGDYYLIVSSEILQDAFCNVGDLYRIGGDEFCGIARNLSDYNFVELRKKIDSKLAAINKNHYVEEKMQIASGFAHFDPILDKTLLDTRSRADALMYQNKLHLKKINESETKRNAVQ